MSTYEESRSQLIPEALRRLVKETGEGTFGGNVKVCHVARLMIIMETLAKERWLLNRKETFNDLTKNVVSTTLSALNMMPSTAGQIIIHCANGKAHSMEFRNNLK